MKKPKINSTKTSKVKKPLSDKDILVTKRFLDLKIQEVKSDITSLRLETKVGLEVVQGQMTKMMVLLEEQNDRNRVALDGYAAVYEKFIDSDNRLEKLEEHAFGNKQK